MTTADGLEAALKAAVDALEPRARRQLFARIAQRLKANTRKRMARERAPDGTPREPRKPDRTGQVRTQIRMMEGLRAARRMKHKATADGAELGYRGVNAMIASVHQFGGIAPVTAGGPTALYPARPMLGMSPADQDFIQREILEHIAGRIRL